jgi:hypothetical protein
MQAVPHSFSKRDAPYLFNELNIERKKSVRCDVHENKKKRQREFFFFFFFFFASRRVNGTIAKQSNVTNRPNDPTKQEAKKQRKKSATTKLTIGDAECDAAKA